MTSNLACLMALCRMICSSWGANLFPTMLSYNMTSHLACIMAFCRVICSSQGAGMFLPRLSFNKTWPASWPSAA